MHTPHHPEVWIYVCMLLDLSSFPELPSPSEVASITVETTSGMQEQLRNLVLQEGKVLARAPVQILHIEGKPGGLQVQWAEVSLMTEITLFCHIFCLVLWFWKQSKYPSSFCLFLQYFRKSYVAGC